MTNTHYSRRDVIKGFAAGSALAVLPSTFLTSCSSLAPSKRSYLTKVVKPENRTATFRWTDIMLQSVRNQSYTPPPATRVFAMAHMAGFLAVNGIQGSYNTPYNIEKGPSTANAEVAYGVAFSMALSEGMQSSFIFDRNHFLAEYPNDESKAQGIQYGRYAANVVIKSRANDGSEPNKANFYLGRYPRRDDVLKWSPTGPFYGAEDAPFLGNFNRGLFPGWGAQKPWVMQSKRSFLANDFPDPRSPEFAEQYNRVKEIGAYDSKSRTEDETEIAFFWEDGPRGVTPPGHWLIVAMNVTQDMNLSLLEQARMFALLSLGQADAAITTWDSKYAHDIVRPETAIRFRTDKMDNPAITGLGQSNWRSLIFTPDFPAYTSGHSTFSGAAARMIANFIGRDEVSFSAEAPDLVNWPKQLAGVRRSWTSLWQAAEENGASRIYGGVHWDADNVEGLRIGKNLADYVFANAFSKAA
nr:phosphatase PAP2 family protein [Cytophagales bacterium]